MLKPFFSFYGSKWRLAKCYPEPMFERIVEPFAGSAGYALNYFQRKVVLIEKDPVIAELWKYLINVQPDQVLQIPLLSDGQGVDDVVFNDPAEKTLVGFWIAKAKAVPAKSQSSWMRKEKGDRLLNNFWGTKIRERVAQQVSHIKHWEVISGDFEQASEISDSTFFIDPPYAVKGKHYRHRMTESDFERLAQMSLCLSGQVIVCENRGADWLPFVDFVTSRSQLKGQRSKEVIFHRTGGV